MKKISISIITYNRPQDLLDLIKSIDRLNQADLILDKVVILNNNSTENYEIVTEYINLSKKTYYYYSVSDINLGVSGGRNKIYESITSSYLLEIDDDMIINQNDFLIRIINFFNNSSDNIGVLGFEVRYFINNELQKNTLLHKNYNKYSKLNTFKTYYFAGGAHVFNMEALKSEKEIYPTDFFYGMEEYDLGYRILDKGFFIQYDNSIKIIHKESPEGRLPSVEKLKKLWINKTIVCYKYLPICYTYTCTTMWGIHFLLYSKFNLLYFSRGIKELFTKIKSTNRRPISDKTIEYLKTVEARLWY